MSKDCGRHILRTWVDTHKKSIRAVPEIYLPGEIDTRDADGELGDLDDITEDDGEDDGEDDSEDDSEDDEYADEDELTNIYIRMKRKATTTTRSGCPTKVAKTMARVGPSNAIQRVVDDHHRADLTLIDAPVDEDVLTHPYGRHGCLYVEAKVNSNKKPSPLEAVSGPFLKVHYY